MDSRRKQKQGLQAIAVQNSQINHRILGFGATPQQNKKKSGSQEAGRGRPGDQEKRKHQEGGRQETTVQQSYLL